MDYELNEETISYTRKRKKLAFFQLGLIVALCVIALISLQGGMDGQWKKTAVIIALLSIAIIGLEIGKQILHRGFLKCSNDAWHDLYERLYKKSSRNYLLLIMAKCRFQEGRFSEALEELEGMKEQSKANAIRVIKLLKFCCHRFLNDLSEDEVQKQYEELQQEEIKEIEQKQKWNESVELCCYGTLEESQMVLGIGKLKKSFKKTCMMQFLILLYLIGLLAYLLIHMIMPSEYAMRSWLVNVSCTILVVGGLVLGAYLIWFIVKLIFTAANRKWLRILLTVIYGIAITGISLIVLFFGILMLADSEQETVQDDGVIMVETPHFLDPSEYSLWKKEGLFLRRYLRPFSDGGTDTSTDTNANADADTSTDTSTDTNADANTDSNTDTENDIATDDQWIEDIYMAIYKQEYNSNAGDEISFSYSAKGVLYATIENSDDTGYRERLVYDRTSENGKCELVVRYRDTLDETGINTDSTSIVNFYGYETLTGTVVAANKTAWADSGSNQYQKLTGEP